MASSRLDFRAATLDIYANPGVDITWRVQVTDEGITVGTITCTAGAATPTVDTSLSITGMLIADITLTDTQTTALGAGSHAWVFSNTVAGVTTRYLVGSVTLTATGNNSNGLQALVTATSGSAHVQTLVSSGATAAIAAHLIDPIDAHNASMISFTPVGTIAATDVQAAIAEAAASAGSGAAVDITFTPAGTIAATNVQTAVAEVATDAATALTAHDVDTTSVHGIADTSALATAASVAAAINAVIDAAPGALDTLNELAAALGDDPAFATTVTNALAGKQPLDSDLTAIAALTTTAYGRALLALADDTAARSAIEVQRTQMIDAADYGTLQGAADAADAAGIPLWIGGNWSISSTVTFLCNVRSNPTATITYTGAGTAIKVGDGTVQRFHLSVHLPKITTTKTWAEGSIGSKTAINVDAVHTADIRFIRITNFSVGLLLKSSGPYGISYGHFFGEAIFETAICLSMDSTTASSWVNENTISIGTYGDPASALPAVKIVGTRAIDMVTGSGGNTINNNVFPRAALEQAKFEYAIKTENAFYNLWIAPRLEVPAGSGEIYFGQTAAGEYSSKNMIIVGYGIEAATITESALSFGNSILGPGIQDLYGSSSTRGLLHVQNANSGNAGGIRVFSPTNPPRANLGKWNVSIGAYRIDYKSENDTEPRLRISPASGQIAFGPGGASATDTTLSRSSAGVLAVGGVPITGRQRSHMTFCRIKDLRFTGNETVASYNTNYATISSGTVVSNWSAIRLTGSHDTRIENVTITGRYCGIGILSSDRVEIQRLNITGLATATTTNPWNFHAAIYLIGGTGCAIDGVNGKNLGSVVLVGGSSTMLSVDNVHAADCFDHGIYISSGIDVTIAGFNLTDIAGAGITVRGDNIVVGPGNIRDCAHGISASGFDTARYDSVFGGASGTSPTPSMSARRWAARSTRQAWLVLPPHIYRGLGVLAVAVAPRSLRQAVTAVQVGTTAVVAPEVGHP